MAVTPYNDAALVADLYNRNTINGELELLLGNTTIGDIPFSWWMYDTSSTATDDFANGVICPTSQIGTTGRWLRINELSAVATSGSYSDLSGKPTIPINNNQLSNGAGYAVASSLATVATTGSYTDLSNQPSIPSAQVNSDWNSSSGVSQILNKPSLATVATSGNYNDLTNKPALTRTQSTVSRSLNSSYQPSTTKDAMCSYSVTVAATVNLSGSQTGTVFLEISPDNSTWTTINTSQLTWSGTLVVGLTLTMTNTQNISGFVPAGYYCRIRTSGTATFSYQNGQEVVYN